MTKKTHIFKVILVQLSKRLTTFTFAPTAESEHFDDAQVPVWQPIGSQIGTQSIAPVRSDQ